MVVQSPERLRELLLFGRVTNNSHLRSRIKNRELQSRLQSLIGYTELKTMMMTMTVMTKTGKWTETSSYLYVQRRKGAR